MFICSFFKEFYPRLKKKALTLSKAPNKSLKLVVEQPLTKWIRPSSTTYIIWSVICSSDAVVISVINDQWCVPQVKADGVTLGTSDWLPRQLFGPGAPAVWKQRIATTGEQWAPLPIVAACGNWQSGHSLSPCFTIPSTPISSYSILEIYQGWRNDFGGGGD